MSLVTKQPFNITPNFLNRLRLAGSKRTETREIDFPQTKSTTISFANTKIEVQNTTARRTGYVRVYIKNGNSIVTRKQMHINPLQRRNLSDFGIFNVNSVVDSFVIEGSRADLVFYSIENSSFELVSGLPDPNLEASDVTSTSMSISWDGTGFVGATFKVLLSSGEETIEYTTEESSVTASGLTNSTAYKVSLYVET